MVDNCIQRDIKNATTIVNIVANSSNKSREGTKFSRTILPAKIVFDKLNCSEIEFVRALKIVKRQFKSVYERITIPKCWDGSSHRFFPEAYESEDKIFCTVNSDDLTANMFYELPSDQIRMWKVNDKVYVPLNHPETIKCLDSKKLLMI